MAEISKLEAIRELKCPRCRKGDMFLFPATNYRKFHKMSERCPVCDLKFEIEPGFFYGAMYFSYAFTIALMIGVSLILYVILGEIKVGIMTLVVTLLILVLLPFIFRYSRVLFLYWFGSVSYRG